MNFRPLCLILLAMSQAGCFGGAMHAPDLQRLYSFNEGTEALPPVVLVHGFMASRLTDQVTGEEVWPGSIQHFERTAYADLAFEIDPDTLEPKSSPLLPTGLAPLGGGLGLDDEILTVLERVGRYSRSTPGATAKPGDRRYYIFHYDWRRDNVETVRQFDEFLRLIRVDYHNPKLKVDVIAHGMGGIIVRYYMRYGTVDVLDDNDFPVNHYGDQYIRRVAMLGVPNLGTIAAVTILGIGRTVSLGTVQAEVFATMPSPYQVLPHPISGSLVDAAGEDVVADLFASDVWDELKWSIYHPKVRERIARGFSDSKDADEYINTLERYFHKRIERGRRFVWSLTVPAPELTDRFIVFGGSCELTPARMLVEPEGGIMALRLTPDEVSNPLADVDYERLMLEPGDGTITKSSLLARHALNPAVPRHEYIYFPLDYALFLCEGHTSLTSNIHFQNNLMNALLRADER